MRIGAYDHRRSVRRTRHHLDTHYAAWAPSVSTRLTVAGLMPSSADSRHHSGQYRRTPGGLRRRRRNRAIGKSRRRFLADLGKNLGTRAKLPADLRSRLANRMARALFDALANGEQPWEDFYITWVLTRCRKSTAFSSPAAYPSTFTRVRAFRLAILVLSGKGNSR